MTFQDVKSFAQERYELAVKMYRDSLSIDPLFYQMDGVMSFYYRTVEDEENQKAAMAYWTEMLDKFDKIGWEE